MKKIVCVLTMIILFTVLLTGCSNVKYYNLPKEKTIDTMLKDGGYKLVFEDNFNGDKIDLTHWSVGYGTPMRRGGYYSEDTVFQKNGNLVIRAEYRENGEHGAGWYTGWVESASPSGGHNVDNRPDYYVGKSASYGYYEVRCKAPKSVGIWSAFWLMPDSGLGSEGMMGNDKIGTSADGIEVDIMESLFYNHTGHRNSVQHVLHGDGYGENTKVASSRIYKVPHMYDDFHTYGVMWTEEEYIFFIDGVETWRTHFDDMGVSHAVSYMLLTNEIAGSVRDGKVYPGVDFDADGNKIKHWAGNPNDNKKNRSYDFVIDYVKLYTNR